jgi:hypothetical protein
MKSAKKMFGGLLGSPDLSENNSKRLSQLHEHINEFQQTQERLRREALDAALELAAKMEANAMKVFSLRMDLPLKPLNYLKVATMAIITGFAGESDFSCGEEVCAIFATIPWVLIFFQMWVNTWEFTKSKPILIEFELPDITIEDSEERNFVIWDHPGHKKKYNVQKSPDPNIMVKFGPDTNAPERSEVQIADAFIAFQKGLKEKKKYKGEIFTYEVMDVKKRREEIKKKHDDLVEAQEIQWKKASKKVEEDNQRLIAKWLSDIEKWQKDEANFYTFAHYLSLSLDAIIILAIFVGLIYTAACEGETYYCNFIGSPSVVIQVTIELHIYIKLNQEVSFDEGAEIVSHHKTVIGKKNNRYSVGDAVEARWKGNEKYFPAKIARVCGNGKYDITYDDGDKEQNVSETFIRSKFGAKNPMQV